MWKKRLKYEIKIDESNENQLRSGTLAQICLAINNGFVNSVTDITSGDVYDCK